MEDEVVEVLNRERRQYDLTWQTPCLVWLGRVVGEGWVRARRRASREVEDIEEDIDDHNTKR